MKHNDCKVFNKNLEVISIGDGLSQAMKNTEGERITDLFNLVRPLVSFTWENVEDKNPTIIFLSKYF